MLAPFPVPDRHFSTPVSLAARGIALRPATHVDIPWLRALYRESRAEEFAPVPWPDDTKQSFLDSQFELQHAHFASRFPSGHFLVVERDAQPVGRLYLSNVDPELVVDICIAKRARNHGIGSALLQTVIARANARHVNVELHVLPRNTAAIRLYERLGFAFVEDLGSHLFMRRTSD
jgi:ribosomal protein S18 acetylase RimI-like enzyme